MWLVGALRRRALLPAAAVAAVQLALLPLALGGANHPGTQWIAHLPLRLRLGQVPDQFLFGPAETGVPHRLAAAPALAGLAPGARPVARGGAPGRRGAGPGSGAVGGRLPPGAPGVGIAR